MASAHDNFSAPRVVAVSSYTTQTSGVAFSNTANTIESGEPASGTSPVQYKSTWYKITPSIKCNMYITPNPSANTGAVWTHVYQDSAGAGANPANFAALQEIATSTGDNQPTTVWTAKPGWTYMARIVQRLNTSSITLAPTFTSSAPVSIITLSSPAEITVEQLTPAKITKPRVQAPAAVMTLELPPANPGRKIRPPAAQFTVEAVPAVIPAHTANQLPAPPLSITVEQPRPSFAVTTLDTVPVQITLETRATSRISSIRNIMSTPEDGETVPALRPTFSVALKRISGGLDDDVRVEVQYALLYGADIDDGPILSQNAAAATFTLLNLDATEDLTEDYYQWRSRIVVDGVAHDWLPARPFVVSVNAGNAAAEILWTVTVSPFVPTPHLWYADPASGRTGDTVTVYGQGMPANPVVKLAGVVMPQLSYTHVPATADATADNRTLLDTEHDVIVVLVPDVPAPGGGLLVEGSY